jgi:hypothetical protein
MPITLHASDSTEQRSAEIALRELINIALDCELNPETLDLGSGVKINVDGIDRSNRILCEVYSRIGRLKGSQPDKVAGDMLKLMLAEKILGGTWRKLICLADLDAAKSFQGRTWLGAAIKTFGFELHVIDLPSNVRECLLAAQMRQVMVNGPRG